MSIESRISDSEVANAFIEQYYTILGECPENSHKFYQESSLLSWPGADGVATRVTTLPGINEKIMSSDYKNWSININNVDAQDSHHGGIIVVVTGSLTGKNITEKNFSQTFFLAQQDSGFFILNDILQFIDGRGMTTNVSDTENQVVSKNLETLTPKDKSLVENTSDSSAASEKDMHLPVPLQTNVKEDAPKLTYASILTKPSPLTSPKAVIDKSKSALPPADAASKMAASRSVLSQAKNTPSNPNNGGSNTNAFVEGCGIYIRDLPFDITKRGLIEVVEKFGPIRRGLDGIQIRRHEDGFCCGFVEFESANSARHAVEANHICFGEKESYITYKRPFKKGNYSREVPLQRTRFPQNSFRQEDVPNGRLESNDRRGYKASLTAQH